MQCCTCHVEMTPVDGIPLAFCPECGLLSNTQTCDPSIYDRSYCVKYRRYDNTDISSRLMDLRFKLLTELCPTNAKELTFLDYGCGSGAFVRYMRSKGFAAFGYDINPHSGYADAHVLWRMPDVVTFFDSIEHLVDPTGTLIYCPAKYVLITTPNAQRYTTSIEAARDIREWKHYYPEEHTHYFCDPSLSAMLKMAGYQMINVSYEESTIRGGGDRYSHLITVGGKRWGK